MGFSNFDVERIEPLKFIEPSGYNGKADIPFRTQDNLAVGLVRARLQRWRAYDEFRNDSTPGKALFDVDYVADAIWETRRPFYTIEARRPNRTFSFVDHIFPEGVEVSEETILDTLRKVRRGEKVIL